MPIKEERRGDCRRNKERGTCRDYCSANRSEQGAFGIQG